MPVNSDNSNRSNQQKGTLHVQHAFFVHFFFRYFAPLQRENLQKLRSYTFYRGNVVRVRVHFFITSITKFSHSSNRKIVSFVFQLSLQISEKKFTVASILHVFFVPFPWERESKKVTEFRKQWILFNYAQKNIGNVQLHILLWSKPILSSEIASLVNQRFQESNALHPDWRLALVYQATPKLPRINNKLLRRVCYEAIDLIISAIDQRLNQESFSSYSQV